MEGEGVNLWIAGFAVDSGVFHQMNLIDTRGSSSVELVASRSGIVRVLTAALAKLSSPAKYFHPWKVENPFNLQTLMLVKMLRLARLARLIRTLRFAIF
jgi:hypothetical protein